MEEMRILSPTAILGYGFPLSSFHNGMERKPDVIAVDAGSTDPGPYYLGAGVSFTDRSAVKRDLEIIIGEGVRAGIPVVIGSAGGSGADRHLRWTADIIREIAREKSLRFSMAVIHAEVPRELVKDRLAGGRVSPLGPAPHLTADELDKTVRVVGQMGTEPIMEALGHGAQVVLAGRAYDPAVFAALPILQGFDRGLSVHLGKILECACIAAAPGSGSDCMMGFLRRDGFLVEPLSESRRCTTLSVAAHTLYEKSDPYHLPGPGGILDLTDTHFEQAGERRVRVAGTRFIPTAPYTVKLEGVKKIGCRTVAIAGTRDPVMIAKMDDIIAGVRERVRDNFRQNDWKYYLDFKIYGRNGVMGSLEPVKTVASHELGIVIETVAETREIADTVCSFTRSTMLHYGYEGRISTAGNLAFPYSPSDFSAGDVYVFSVYHLMEVADPGELFPIEYTTSIE